jgi:hypothetical protein
MTAEMAQLFGQWIGVQLVDVQENDSRKHSIEYLREENRVLREQLAAKPSFHANSARSYRFANASPMKFGISTRWDMFRAIQCSPARIESFEWSPGRRERGNSSCALAPATSQVVNHLRSRTGMPNEARAYPKNAEAGSAVDSARTLCLCRLDAGLLRVRSDGHLEFPERERRKLERLLTRGQDA